MTEGLSYQPFQTWPINFRFCVLSLLGVSLMAVLVGCDSPKPGNSSIQSESKTNRVVAASYALEYLTSRIAGDKCKVDFPASDAGDPRKWSPSVDEIRAIQESDLIIVNGAGADFAEWIVRVTLPKSKICNSCQGFELNQYIAVKDYRIVHSHGPEGEHSHPYFVPYTWLDPEIAILQSKNICIALSETYPKSSRDFEENLNLLIQDLEQIELEFNEEIAKSASTKVVSANPQMKYLTRFLKLDDKHLFWFDLPTFSNGEIDQLQSEFEDRTIGFAAQIFMVDQSPTPAISKFLSDKGLTTVQIELLGKKPENGDYLSALRTNIRGVLDAVNTK